MSVRKILYLLPLLFCCCKKHSDPAPTPDPNFNFEYTAVYDSVITMQANSEYNFLFRIDVSNGDISNNRLACSITNMPGNTSVMPSIMSVGQVKGGMFVIKAGDIALGTDTLHFNISSASTGLTVRRILLKIIPPIDFAPKLTGTYDSSYDNCNTGLFKHRSVVTTDSAYMLRITNLNGLGDAFSVRARVSDVITIPYQAIDGKKIWGSGTYTRDPMTGNVLYQMTISDTIVTGIDTVACTAHVQHL